jgi:hypothetical protein
MIFAVQIDLDIAANRDIISAGKVQIDGINRPLDGDQIISDIWEMQPSNGFANVFIRLPDSQ